MKDSTYIIIARTILEYYREKNREFRQTAYAYNKCMDMQLRRELRKKKEYLNDILYNATILYKMTLSGNYKIKYKDLDNSKLVELKQKEMYLKRAIT